jgi:hypothetical protein
MGSVHAYNAFVVPELNLYLSQGRFGKRLTCKDLEKRPDYKTMTRR